LVRILVGYMRDEGAFGKVIDVYAFLFYFIWIIREEICGTLRRKFVDVGLVLLESDMWIGQVGFIETYGLVYDISI